jgi:hypothetical protein
MPAFASSSSAELRRRRMVRLGSPRISMWSTGGTPRTCADLRGHSRLTSRICGARGLNFTLVSKLGDLDLLGEIVGGGGFDDLIEDSIEIELFGVRCHCLGLRKLIEVKRAAGRPKDLESLAELEELLSRTPNGE